MKVQLNPVYDPLAVFILIMIDMMMNLLVL
jgi:hypothetical protein